MKLPLARPSNALRPAVRRFRYARDGDRMLPTFIIIGAQRAGTTTLFLYLRSHPTSRGRSGPIQLGLSAKETPLLRRALRRRASIGIAPSSRSALAGARPRGEGNDLDTGEATPNYSSIPLVPERVATTCSGRAPIVLLRDPVERAYSHYQLMVRTGREKLVVRGGCRGRAASGLPGCRRTSSPK